MNTAASRHGVMTFRRRAGFLGWVVAVGMSTLLPAASALGAPPPVVGEAHDSGADSVGRRFASPADSADWEVARALAARARGFRVVVSILDRRLWAIIDADTLLDVPVAVASGSALEYQGRRWMFTTPRGRRRIVAKDSLPTWAPPDWHYYEVARARGLVVRTVVAGKPVNLADGRRLEVRGSVVGLVGPDSTFTPHPPDEEIIYDGSLFIPPLGSASRRIVGELGAYRLDLGGGYLLHGTPHLGSIGEAATHGCIRLRDADIAWLYEFVPVGVAVYVY